MTYFVYDLAGSDTPGLAPLVAEYDENGNLVAKYHHDGGGLLAMTRNNATSWHVFEAIGTVRQLVNEQPQVTDSYAFDAWGNELATQGSTVNPHRYVGKHGYYLDTQSALMLLGVRYYGAGMGRFITTDPLKLKYNWYVYTMNRPTILIDPNGKSPITVVCAVACTCVALCGIAIVGGCIAGCSDSGNLTLECIGDCIRDVLDELPPFQAALCAACLGGCLACIGCFLFKKCGPPPDPIEPPSDGKRECPPWKPPPGFDPCEEQADDCRLRCSQHCFGQPSVNYLGCIVCCWDEEEFCNKVGPGFRFLCAEIHCGAPLPWPRL